MRIALNGKAYLKKGSLVGLLFFLCISLPAESESAPSPGAITSLTTASVSDVSAELHGYPLEEDAFKRVMVGVHVNGVGPFPFIIDTGASRSIIYRSLTAMLKLEAIPFQSRNIITANGYRRALIYPIGDIFALGRTLQIAETVALPDIPGSSAKGLIGVDLLSGRILHVRPQASLAELVTDSHVFDGPAWTAVQGRPVAYGSLALSVEIGGVTVPVVVDTGASDTVINKAGAETLLRAASGVRSEKTTAVVARGRAVAREKLILPNFSLGSKSFEDTRIYVADVPVFRLLGASKVPAIILGMNVLKQQDFAIDFAAWRLYLHTNAAADLAN